MPTENRSNADQQPVLTIQLPDPHDERPGPWFDAKELRALAKLPAGTKLYTHPAPSEPQGEPAAWLYKGTTTGDMLSLTRKEDHFECKYSDYGEKVKGEPLYTHPEPAHPGEAERLRTELDHMREERDDLSRKLDRFYSRTHGIKNLSVIEQLNDQLADRDALLAQMLERLNKAQIFGWDKKVAALSASAEPSSLAVSIPDGYCLMPKQLTAENGAKALLLGEFKLEVTHECPECLELDEPAEGCEICDGEGEYGQRHTIPWDKIKFIYSVAVKGLALTPGATSKTP